jgi:serine/threonine protein kinase/tetratricopeptide (TPR) repeat protein
LIGQNLSHYRITAEIGAGGMGEVYRAEDTKLEREVALKVLPEEMASATDRLDRFRREAKTVAALNHPNIVTIFSVEEENGVHFLTMELVEGKTLDALLPSDGFSLDRFYDLAIPIADALASAHGRGIVHRDLKPANIMVTAEGNRVKVLDFGLAKLLESEVADGTTQLPTEALTQLGLVVGTPHYMSPEQAKGEVVDRRSDIFSLGVMLFEMATGQRPFQGASSVELLSSVLKDTPPLLTAIKPELPRHLGRVVGRCLEKAPIDRFQTARDVHNELRALRKETSSGPTHPPSSDSVLRRSQPEAPGVPRPALGRLPLGLLTLVVLVLVVFLVLRFRPSGEEPVSRPAEIAKLAVLPLDDLSSARDQDWFAAGVHEALLAALQQVDGLRVTSRTSAMRYQNTDKLLPEIARELGVQWLVEGSVARVGDRIRINVQLVDGEDDLQVWSRQYERDVRDVLALQNQLARTIAIEIHVALTPEEEERLAEAPRVDPETYRQYVLGLQHFDRVTPSDFLESIESFEQAIASDPDFAPAHAALAIAYGIAVEYSWISRAEAAPLAERAAEAALRLDPGSGDAHHALASVQFHVHRDFPVAEQSYRHALELSSSAHIFFGYGWLLSQMGRHEEAVEALERAVELDPRSPLMHGDLGWWLYGARRFDRAIDEAEIAIDLDPEQPEPYWLLAAAHSQKGQFDIALDAFSRYEELYGEAVPWFRGYLYALAGQRDEAMSALEQLEQRVEGGQSPRIELAQIYLGLGDDERTIEVLEQANEAGVSFQPYLWPEYERLFAEPRFERVLQRLGYPTESLR